MKTPDETIGRLFVYLRALLCLAEKGVKTVSSSALGDLCAVKSSTTRKDLSCFGGFGKRGVGYDVQGLIKEIRSILNLDKLLKAALVGVGNIGKALLLYPGVKREGFEITLAFDEDEEKMGLELNGVVIEDIANLERRVKEEGVKLGIVAVPVPAAHRIAERLAKAGVKAILSLLVLSICPKM